MTKNEEWLSKQGESCNIFVNAVVRLAGARLRLYCRFLEEINNMSKKRLSSLAQDLQTENFKDTIDVIL